LAAFVKLLDLGFPARFSPEGLGTLGSRLSAGHFGAPLRLSMSEHWPVCRQEAPHVMHPCEAQDSFREAEAVSVFQTPKRLTLRVKASREDALVAGGREFESRCRDHSFRRPQLHGASAINTAHSVVHSG
jgi:hypothetical protein